VCSNIETIRNIVQSIYLVEDTDGRTYKVEGYILEEDILCVESYYSCNEEYRISFRELIDEAYKLYSLERIPLL